MSEESNAPGHIPAVGLVVSIQSQAKEPMVATVISNSPGEIRVKLARPRSKDPFQQGDGVRIKYWDEGTIAYYWNAQVLEVEDDHEITISVREVGVAVQRRKTYRLALKVPVTITVMDAASRELECGASVSSHTENLSQSGMLCETDFPLSIGDKVEVHLQFTESDKISAFGAVVRATQVESQGPSRSAVAVEFLHIEEEAQTQMFNFLAHYADDG
ncbi:MAG: PilZ domain-containing protein [Acidobacteriota bacterium]